MHIIFNVWWPETIGLVSKKQFFEKLDRIMSTQGKINITCGSFTDVWAIYFACKLRTEKGKCVATVCRVKRSATQSAYTDFKMVQMFLDKFVHRLKSKNYHLKSIYLLVLIYIYIYIRLNTFTGVKQHLVWKEKSPRDKDASTLGSRVRHNADKAHFSCKSAGLQAPNCLSKRKISSRRQCYAGKDL